MLQWNMRLQMHVPLFNGLILNKLSVGSILLCISVLEMGVDFRFSQCQAIHARSMLPCQDTPSVKAPWKAQIRSPLRVLTSGQQLSSHIHSDNTTTYTSSQPVPVPSYLITLAAGGTSLTHQAN